MDHLENPSWFYCQVLCLPIPLLSSLCLVPWMLNKHNVPSARSQDLSGQTNKQHYNNCKWRPIFMQSIKGEAPLISACVLHFATLLPPLPSPSLTTALTPRPTHSADPSSTYSQYSPCCWVGLKGKENVLTHQLFIEPFLSLCFSTVNVRCIYRAGNEVSWDGNYEMEKCSAGDWELVWQTKAMECLKKSIERRKGFSSPLDLPGVCPSASPYQLLLHHLSFQLRYLVHLIPAFTYYSIWQWDRVFTCYASLSLSLPPIHTYCPFPSSFWVLQGYCVHVKPKCLQ